MSVGNVFVVCLLPLSVGNVFVVHWYASVLVYIAPLLDVSGFVYDALTMEVGVPEALMNRQQQRNCCDRCDCPVTADVISVLHGCRARLRAAHVPSPLYSLVYPTVR